MWRVEEHAQLLINHRRRLVKIWFSFALVSFLVYAYLNYRRGTYVLMSVDLACAGATVLLLHRARRMQSFFVVALFTTGAFVLLVVATGLRGFIEGYFWAASAPIILFVLCGYRIGGALTAVVALTMIVSLAIKPHPGVHINLPLTIMGAFGTMVFLVVMYERLREGYEAELNRLSLKDALTGSWNRRKFDEALAEEILRSHRYGRPMSLVTFDVDHFKNINDTYGHGAGDAMLQAIVDVCNRATRQTDLVVRLGGDEFSIVLPETSARHPADGGSKGGGAVMVAERVRAGVSQLRFESGMQATISSGVAQLQPHEDGAALKERADGALYEAKRQGRNRYHVAAGEAPTNVFVPSSRLV